MDNLLVRRANILCYILALVAQVIFIAEVTWGTTCQLNTIFSWNLALPTLTVFFLITVPRFVYMTLIIGAVIWLMVKEARIRTVEQHLMQNVICLTVTSGLMLLYLYLMYAPLINRLLGIGVYYADWS